MLHMHLPRSFKTMMHRGDRNERSSSSASSSSSGRGRSGLKIVTSSSAPPHHQAITSSSSNTAPERSSTIQRSPYNAPRLTAIHPYPALNAEKYLRDTSPMSYYYTPPSLSRGTSSTRTTTRDRSPSTSSAKSGFSSRSTIYSISPPQQAHLEVAWRFRRAAWESVGSLGGFSFTDDNNVSSEIDAAATSFGGMIDGGEVLFLEPRPERAHMMKGLWEAMNSER
ncbi:hypothetical protein DFH27DRAFT_522268 [Peziza echinospora]|nr:hypothetical protein DFH27DRAFT_522268 [Peziza echinospora]